MQTYAKIYYTETRTDNRGREWYYINGDTGYLPKDWTKEDAEAHYVSKEATLERDIEERRAWGYYD